MDLRALEYFVAVADEKSFTRAAERCHVAQPAISQQIQGLERELGEVLFDRSGRRVALAPGALALLPYARACLSSAAAARAEFAERSGLLRGALTLGTVDGLEKTPFPRLLGVFNRRYPLISVTLTGGSSTALFEMLIHRRLDASVIAAQVRPLSDGLASRTMLRSHVMAVVARDSPLANAENLSIATVAEYPIITYQPGSGLRTLLDEAFANAGLALSVAYATNDVALQVALAKEGIGIALAAGSDPAVQGDARAVLIPLDPPIGYQKILVWRHEIHASPPLRAFLEVWDEVIAGREGDDKVRAAVAAV